MFKGGTLVAIAENKALVRRLIEAVNQGDMNSVGALFHNDDPDVKVEDLNKIARTAMPDLRLTIDDTIAERDKVVIRWRAEGTHKGAGRHHLLGNVKATNRRLAVTGITILQLKGGRVVEAWGETSELDALSQLGALPKLG
jgi:predicted ester cyclase